MNLAYWLLLFAALCYLNVGYAIWEAAFHRRNMWRILDGRTAREHRWHWQKRLCERVTGK